MVNGTQRIDIVKKLEEAERPRKADKGRSAGIDIDTIILAGLERGLTLTDIKKMQIGQVVDFCVAYNERQKAAEKAQKRAEKYGTRRKGTQNDINAFFG